MIRCPNRHRNCWVLSSHWLWCPDCGALRSDNKTDRWVYPDGQTKALQTQMKNRERARGAA